MSHALPSNKSTSPFDYICHGVQVHDKSISKTVTFEWSKPALIPLINNIRLTIPASLHGDETVAFVGSSRIIIKEKGPIFKLIEQGEYGRQIFLIDTSKKVNEIAYDCYRHPLRDMTSTEASKKLSRISPHIVVKYAAYNRHGVAAIGLDPTSLKYYLFWGSSIDAKMTQIRAQVFIYIEAGIYAYSKDKDISFWYSSANKEGHSLSRESAKRIKIY